VNDWIKNNPDEARESMGATRYQLYTDGKMKIDRYTDAKFEPLTLKDLKRQNEIAFKKAGIDLGDSGLPTGGGTPTPTRGKHHRNHLSRQPFQVQLQQQFRKHQSRKRSQNQLRNHQTEQKTSNRICQRSWNKTKPNFHA